MNRYGLTAEHVDDLVKPGTLRYGLWKVPDIDMLEYSLYAVTAADLKRIDMIAYKVYGDVTLWWVVAIMNNISNPLEDLVVGTTLKLPTRAAITQAMAGSQ